MDELKKIPGVDTLLNTTEIRELTESSNKEFVTYVIRKELDRIKGEVKSGHILIDEKSILKRIIKEVSRLKSGNLKKVINATGIIIHTNLGRAPYSTELLTETFEILNGYSNLEFDLNTANRGSRNAHASELLQYFCGAEDILVVNNNAAAVVLILRAFSKGKEVIVSRGELIEIGGSFRLPDIIKTADCKMVEVGTTNKTRVSDYENAINEETRILFKAHTSNYSIEGFTQEVSLKELVSLGKKYDIPVIYDMGSGLLNNQINDAFKNELNVKQTLQAGVDLVCFSGDKLLGGPQSGIIAGNKKLIQKLKKEPFLRALRVDKLTLAFLEANSKYFLDESTLNERNQFYKILHQSVEELQKKAEKLKTRLLKYRIASQVVTNKGQFGGGALPGKEISSFAVKLIINKDNARKKSELPEKLYKALLRQDLPILGFLRKGHLFFDVLCLPDEELSLVSEAIGSTYQQLTK